MEVTVELLDDQLDDIVFKYKKDVKARKLMDHVCETLQLEERDYFGLRYYDKEKRKCWLDLTKSIHKQFKGLPQPRIVNFRVRFYPSVPSKLKEEISKYHLFLQLKKDLKKGRLNCSFEEAARLGAYIIQANTGDFDPEVHLDGYASEFDLFPTLQDSLRMRIEELHKTTLVGVISSEAETDFMEEACNLMTYGVDPISVTDDYGTQMTMGFSFRGVLLLRNGQLLDRMEWETVRKIAHDGKNLVIGTLTGQGNKNKRIFHFAHSAAAEHAGRLALEKQAFFQNNISLTLRRSGSFILRRSSFRFKGTTQKDAQEKSQSLKRDEPRVDRLPPIIRSKRSRSLHDQSTDISDTMEEDGPSLRKSSQGSPSLSSQQEKDSPTSSTGPAGDTIDGSFKIEMVHVSERPKVVCINPSPPILSINPSQAINSNLNPVSEMEEIEFKPAEGEVSPTILREETIIFEEPVMERKGMYEESLSPKFSQNFSPPYENNKQENNHVNYIHHEQKPEEKSASNIVLKAVLILFFILCAIALTMVVLFETKSEYLRPVRQLKFVKSTNHALYKPSRSFVLGSANQMAGFIQQLLAGQTKASVKK